MRRIATIWAPVAILAVWAGLASWSCEESLEACPPCEAVSGNNLTGLSGDPRIDATVWVANELVARFEREWEAYARDLEKLAEAFSFSSSPKQLPTREGVEALAEKIKKTLFEGGSTVAVAYEPARCAVSSQRAAQAMLTCQDRLDCYLSDDCRAKIDAEEVDGTCQGLCMGTCSGACLGHCYADSQAEGRACEGFCAGVCLASSRGCSGLCIGGCEGEDFAADARPCEGTCSLGCLTRYGAECEGVCHGRCGRDSDGPCIGECRGMCDPSADVCAGECRGHFRPTGCEPTLCDDRSLIECREISRLVGWGAMTCQPAHLALRDLQSETLESALAERALQIATLREVLERVSARQAFFSLLVDARDISGEIEAQHLSEAGYLEELDYPAVLLYLFADQSDAVSDDEEWRTTGIPSGAVFHPLFSLMARLSYLADRSSSDRDYLIPEGIAGCVEPALAKALSGLRSIAPVTSEDGGGSIANRQAAGSVYSLIDTQQALLDLIASDESSRIR